MTLWQTKLASLVKRANTRISALEKKGLHFGKAIQGLYKEKYTKDEYMFSTSKSGNIKFTTSISKLSHHEQRKLYYAVNRFLKNKESTISGVKKEEKRKEVIRENMFNDIISTFSSLTKEDILIIFNDARTQQLVKNATYSSDSILAYANDAKENGKTINAFLNKLNQMSRSELERWCMGKDDDTKDKKFNSNWRY